MKLFAATLLALCVGVHLLEASGRWDRTFQDANDEAGIVAVVLCVGVAFAAARTVIRAVRLIRIPRLFTGMFARVSTLSPVPPLVPHSFGSGPPLPLRV